MPHSQMLHVYMCKNQCIHLTLSILFASKFSHNIDTCYLNGAQVATESSRLNIDPGKLLWWYTILQWNMWYEWSLINTLQSDTFSRMLSQCWTHTKAAVKAPSQSVLIDNTCGCFVLILIQPSKGSLTVWLTYSKLYSSFGYRNRTVSNESGGEINVSYLWVIRIIDLQLSRPQFFVIDEGVCRETEPLEDRLLSLSLLSVSLLVIKHVIVYSVT